MPIPSADYKEVLRHFPAGVTIVTVRVGEEVHGLTVSAFVSVSPTPPLILVAIDHRNRGHEMLERSNAVFAVNILNEKQAALSDHFAWKDEDRFAMGNWGSAETGAPILTDALAWMDCTIYSRHTAGMNTIYIGEVQASSVVTPDAKPLVYWNRKYRCVQDMPKE